MSDPVVILEGLNGVGKSTYAKLLSEKFKVPIVRPFRHSKTDIHWGHGEGAKLQAALERFGVPVNTHVDDLYVADFLSLYEVGAILDRGVPSGIIYPLMRGERTPWADGDFVGNLVMFWLHQLSRLRNKVYVWLHAPYDTAQQRCGERWCPERSEYTKMHDWYAMTYDLIRGFPKTSVDTSKAALGDGVEEICRALKSSDAG